jgi:hypothetical protein
MAVLMLKCFLIAIRHRGSLGRSGASEHSM